MRPSLIGKYALLSRRLLTVAGLSLLAACGEIVAPVGPGASSAGIAQDAHATTLPDSTVNTTGRYWNAVARSRSSNYAIAY